MKSLGIAVAAMAVGLAASGASAHEGLSGGSNHWVDHPGKQGESSQQGAGVQDPLGYPVRARADRTIALDAPPRYVNVKRSETVAFTRGGKILVVWKFDTLGTPNFPLSEIVSGAVGTHVYVALNPDDL